MAAEKQAKKGSKKKPLKQKSGVKDRKVDKSSSENPTAESFTIISPGAEAPPNTEEADAEKDTGLSKPAETKVKKPKLTKEERDARWERKIRIRDRREARILRENCISQSGLN